MLAHGWLAVAYATAVVSGLFLFGGYGLAVGAREIVRMTSVLAAFLVVLWWAREAPDRYRVGWYYLILGTAVPIVVALLQLASGTGNREVEGINRLQGTFSHPNAFGPFLVPFILLAIGAVRRAKAVARVLLFGAAAGLSVMVGLTYSRTAVLVLVCGLLVLPALQVRRLGWRALRGSAVAAAVFAVIGWVLIGPVIRERFSDVRIGAEVLDAARTGALENTLEWRLMNWGVLISTGMEHPLAGHGAGMTMELNPVVNPDSGLPYNAHNDFVRFFFEGGFLGLIAYLVYGLLLCRWTLAAARIAPAARAPSAYAVAAAVLALFFLTVGTPEFGQQTALQYELYGMLALMTAPVAQAPPDESESGSIMESERTP
jgi:O-antigen ligase